MQKSSQFQVSNLKPYAPLIGGLALGSAASLLTDSRIRGQISQKFSDLGNSERISGISQKFSETFSGKFSGLSDRFSDLSGKFSDFTSEGTEAMGGWFSGVIGQAKGVWEKVGLIPGSEGTQKTGDSQRSDSLSADQDSENIMDDDVDTGAASSDSQSLSQSNEGETRNRKENVHHNEKIIPTKNLH